MSSAPVTVGVLIKKTKKEEGRKETSVNKKGLGNFILCLCLSVEKKTRGSRVFSCSWWWGGRRGSISFRNEEEEGTDMFPVPFFKLLVVCVYQKPAKRRVSRAPV